MSSKLPFGKSWNQSCPSQYSTRQISWFTQNYFHRFLGVPKLSHYISWFNQTIPSFFSFAQTIPMHYLLALPKLSRMMPVEFFFAPTISCSYILNCHTPVCCNCKNLLKCLNLALDGFQLEYAPRQWEIMHQKNAWFWSGKVARSVFVTFEGYTLPQKEIKCQQSELNGIPTSFPVLAAEIQMTMPGSNTLHWPRPKIVYIYICRSL